MRSKPKRAALYLFSISVKCRCQNQLTSLLSCDSASGVATQTMLKTTRGVAFRARRGGTGLLRRVPPASRSPTRRRGMRTTTAILSRREMCQCRREHPNTSRETKDMTIRSPSTPTPSFSPPHAHGIVLTKKSYPPASRSPTSRSSWWDHTALLMIMTLRTSRSLARAIIQRRGGKEKVFLLRLDGV